MRMVMRAERQQCKPARLSSSLINMCDHRKNAGAAD
jgi:hypothetical protein